MSRDQEFRAKEKKLHKMTRDGLVERGAATGEETRISQREREFDLRQARDAPEDLQPGRGPEPARAERRQRTDLASDSAGAPPQGGEQPGYFTDGEPPEQTAPAQGAAPVGASAPAAPSGERPAAAKAARPARLRLDDTPPPDGAGTGQTEHSASQHGTRYQQKFMDEAERAGGQGTQQEPQRASKLEFTADELPPEPPGKKLTDARRKAERTAEKLEKAEQNLPARRKLRIGVDSDPETGKAKRRLRFEKEVKPQHVHVKGPLPLRPVKKGANAAIGFAHKKLYEVEHENVGTEAAHKGELMAEGGLRTLYHRHKTAPYRKVSRLQKKATKTSARAAYQQVLHDNPKLKSTLWGRMLQKRKIKRQYAKAAREAKRAGQAAKKTAVTTEKIGTHVVLFVKRHPIIFGVLALLLLLIFLITSVFSSCSNMGVGGLGGVVGSSYLADDKDINDAELVYTEWETDLQMRIDRAEADHPGYDEYRYQVDDIGHNPYELMGFLTAAYQNFTYAQVQAVLRQLFEEQYTLEFVEEVEIRYRTETRTDPETGESYEVEVPYEWHILNINLTARPFAELTDGRMTDEQRQIYGYLMQTKGNRQYVANVFGETNWLPYVTSYYGYRVHPISGGKDYHKAVDIGMAQGTDILAGHDGVVTQAGSAGDYGLLVVLEGKVAGSHTLTTKYAHCSQLLVSAGQEVKQGDVIAKVGSTGNSTGPHLHLEVLVDGQHLNPLYFAATGDDGSGGLPPGTPGGPEIPAYPGEPMGDGSYAALMEEAQKHLGKPYVFGAKGPDKFDCSGFVCWSLTHSGVKNISTNAQGLYNASTPVSRENARPGDLIFFQGTYSTPNTVTHVGIYIGNGQMIHAGKPVQYSSIDTRYWTEHFYAFGRIT